MLRQKHSYRKGIEARQKPKSKEKERFTIQQKQLKAKFSA